MIAQIIPGNQTIGLTMSEFQVMASNDLRTGRVVYLTADGQWSADFQLAKRLTDESAVGFAEQQSGNAVDGNWVVDPYLVKVIAGTASPSHIRERIRRTGPTCLPTSHESGNDISQHVAG